MSKRRGNSEGSIGTRKDGTYYGAILIDGKRQWVYGATRKEVADKIKALQQKAEQGIQLHADKVTLSAFLDRWLEEVVKQKNKYRTYVGYKQIVDMHIKPALGTITLAALHPDKVQALINSLIAADKAPRTIRNVRAVLRKALNQAVRWRYITFNAAALVETPRIEQHKINPLTKAEARVFLDVIKGHRLEVLYLLALYLGLREGELLGLQICSVDLAHPAITINGALQWQKGKLVRVTTKTKASIRTLPLPPSIVPLLKAHIEDQQAQYPKGEWLFTAADGGPLSPFTLIPQFKGLLKKAEIRAIRFHDLRHSCATFLIAQGEHPRTVMDILGHSQISTTMNVYGHILDDTRTAAISGLDGLLNS